MVSIAAIVAESSAGLEISADHGPAGLARLPRSRQLRRTTRPAVIPDTIALRKAAEAVAFKAAVEAAIAALRHLAAVAVDRMAAVVGRLAAADLTAGAADLAAEAMADSQPNNDLPSAR